MMRAVLSAMLLFALALSGVRAAPLDAATCGQLKGEQARMEQEGVRNSMTKGPEWAKANLPADRLAQIRRLIDVDEQLLFRCSARNLVELPPDADADPVLGKADEAGKDTPAKADAAAKKEAPSKKDAPAEAKKPAAKAPAAQAKAPASQVKEAPKAKESPKAKPAAKKPQKDAANEPAKAWPKPKVTVDDAYRPPPSNPDVNPFAGQSWDPK